MIDRDLHAAHAMLSECRASLRTIRAHANPPAAGLPDDPRDRCEEYARILSQINNVCLVVLSRFPSN
jgi:hypothetical protein